MSTACPVSDPHPRRAALDRLILRAGLVLVHWAERRSLLRVERHRRTALKAARHAEAATTIDGTRDRMRRDHGFAGR